MYTRNIDARFNLPAVRAFLTCIKKDPWGLGFARWFYYTRKRRSRDNNGICVCSYFLPELPQPAARTATSDNVTYRLLRGRVLPFSMHERDKTGYRNLSSWKFGLAASWKWLRFESEKFVLGVLNDFSDARLGKRLREFLLIFLLKFVTLVQVKKSGISSSLST